MYTSFVLHHEKTCDICSKINLEPNRESNNQDPKNRQDRRSLNPKCFKSFRIDSYRIIIAASRNAVIYYTYITEPIRDII